MNFPVLSGPFVSFSFFTIYCIEQEQEGNCLTFGTLHSHFLHVSDIQLNHQQHAERARVNRARSLLSMFQHGSPLFGRGFLMRRMWRTNSRPILSSGSRQTMARLLFEMLRMQTAPGLGLNMFRSRGKYLLQGRLLQVSNQPRCR